VSNLEYTYVTSENCSELGSGSDYFILDEGLVITDRVNLQQERLFALMDFIEALCWLIIVVLIEIDIRIQTRGVDSLTLTKTSSYVKLMAYITIFCLAIYWALTGHLLYFWDELLWIGGFAAIEMNVAEWREEILEENSLA
jgi:hypothetical protein